MINKPLGIIFILSVLLLFLNGCANSKFNKKYNKPFKHNTPLIKDNVKLTGKAEVDKTVEMGPTPIDGDHKKLTKRKQISSVKERNYLLIPEDYVSL